MFNSAKREKDREMEIRTREIGLVEIKVNEKRESEKERRKERNGPEGQRYRG